MDNIAVHNQELKALEEYSKTAVKPVPDACLEVLKRIAQTGRYTHPWPLIQPVLIARLDEVLTDSQARYPDCPNRPSETFKEKRELLLASLKEFALAPFTLQRLCELLVRPYAHHRSTYKLIGSLDKVLAVCSTFGASDPSDPMPSAIHWAAGDGGGAATGGGAAAGAAGGLADDDEDVDMVDVSRYDATDPPDRR